jgi:hypothetical protein
MNCNLTNTRALFLQEVKKCLKTAGLAGDCFVHKQIDSACSAFFVFFLVASITNYSIQLSNVGIHRHLTPISTFGWRLFWVLYKGAWTEKAH